MAPSTLQQVKSGFLRAGEIILGFLTFYLVLDGLTRRDGPGILRIAGVSGIALLEFGIAVVIMIPTARWWARVVPGYLFVVGIKSIVILLRGTSLMSPHLVVSRAFSAELAIFCLLGTLLTVRFASKQPKLYQSLILTALVFMTLAEALFVTSNTPVPLAAGLGLLGLDWAFEKRKHHRRPHIVPRESGTV